MDTTHTMDPNPDNGPAAEPRGTAPSDIEVSVVFATYRRPHSCVELLQDLEKQELSEGRRFEVVVTNDGSPDNTKEVLAAYVQNSALAQAGRLTVLHQENQGQAAARQNGVQHAKGRILIFIDDDERLTSPHFVEWHAQHHRTHGECVVIGRIRSDVGLTEMPPYEAFFYKSMAKMHAGFRSGKKPCGENFYTGNVSVTRSAFDRVGGFNRDFRQGEDKELGIRLDAVGHVPFVFEDRAEVIHHCDKTEAPAFRKRARQWGYFDWGIAEAYPTRLEAHPAHLLVLGGALRRLMIKCLLMGGFVRSVLGKAGEGAVWILRRLNRHNAATSLCSLVFNASYIDGLIQAAGSKEKLQQHIKEHLAMASSHEPPGRHLLKDIKEDAKRLLHFEGRTPSLKQYFWLFFFLDGFGLLFWHRIRHYFLIHRKIPIFSALLNTLLRRWVLVRYGAELWPWIQVGRGVYFVHTVGLVIGGNAVIGDETMFMGQCTVGSTGEGGCPRIGKRVVVAAGARLLGDFTVGDEAEIGANAVVLKDVPPNTVCLSAPARPMGNAPKVFGATSHIKAAGQKEIGRA